MKWQPMSEMPKQDGKDCGRHLEYLLYDEGAFYLGRWLCGGCGGPGWDVDGITTCAELKKWEDEPKLNLAKDIDFQYFCLIESPE